MSNETTNNHKESLDEIEVGDTIITISSTGHGVRHHQHVVTKVTRTQITIGTTYPAIYRKNDGHCMGDKYGRTVAYAPNQIVNPWSAEKETALQRMEAADAATAAKAKRNNNQRFIENNLRNVSDELLTKIAAMMAEEKSKRDAEF